MIEKKYKTAIELWWNSLDDKQKLKAMLNLLSEASEAEIVNVYSVEGANERAEQDGARSLFTYMAPTWYHTGGPIHK